MNIIRIASLGLLFILSLTKVTAQSSITGKVLDEGGVPLSFANILIKGTANGTTTDFDGLFTIKDVNNDDSIVVSMIGFKTKEITVGTNREFTIVLQENAEALDEIVVTGVAVGTSVRKLTFALSKVNKEQLKEAPAGDLGNSLRGKVAGVRIVQANGDPNTAASIRLRGSTSLMGSQDPLIIIDGIITGRETSLRDINMEDVESIEVIKGAAASSLYGSLSGNGVIQIITKRGKNTDGKPTIVLRNETGFSQITNKYPLANTHRFKLKDANVASWNLNDLNDPGRWELSSGGNRVYDEDGLLDNPFPRVLDHQSKINTAQPFNSLYTSISSGTSNFKYHLSFQNTKNGGAVTGVKPSVRNNGRLNIDYTPDEKLSLKTSFAYTDTKGHYAPSSTRMNGLYLEPWIDIDERDNAGNIVPTPQGSQHLRRYRDNPLYEVKILENYFNRQRLMFSPNLTYRLTDSFTVGASYSHDESRTDTYDYKPKEYNDPDPNNDDDGNYSIENDISKTGIIQLSASYAKKIGDFNTRVTGKFLRENRTFSTSYAYGSKLAFGGVKNLSLTESTTRIIRSAQEERKVSNYFLDFNLDYKDKIIFNGLIRRDGSSLFGKENRWGTFGRTSLAYILTEDITIPHVDNLKLRFSWGVSGQRPGFSDQYETYSIDRRSGVLSRTQAGNVKLISSKVSEWEAGLNARLFNRLNLEINYAKAKVESDFINTPQAVVTGAPLKIQNIANISTSSFEIQLGADLIKTKDINWNVNVSWDKITQEITSIGGIPPFGRSRRIFRAEPGKPYGQMYGYKIATNSNQLTTNTDGYVINGLGSPNADVRGTIKPTDFETNEQGYLIIKGTKGTKNEQVIYLSDENGDDKKVALGDTNPDWNLGLSSSFSYKNFNLYFVIDHQHGGDIYNSTKQSMYREERHADQEKFARQGKHILYSNNASNLDRGFADTSHFVEDGTFTKVRELALGYTLNESVLGEKFSKYIKEVKFSLIGRNLLTITDYTGFDPEVAHASEPRGGQLRSSTPNPTNDKLDRRAYPQFRTFTAMVQFTF